MIICIICIKINMTKKFTLHVEQFTMYSNVTKSQIYNVCRLVVIYAVLAQSPFCQDLQTFVWSQNQLKTLNCGAKMTNIMYAPLGNGCLVVSGSFGKCSITIVLSGAICVLM